MAKSSKADGLDRLNLQNWKEGEVSSFYAARVPDSGLAIAQDSLVQQNGTVGDRGSFLRDTIDTLPHPLLGNIYVYKLADNSENLICMLNTTDTVLPTPIYCFPTGVGTNNTWTNSANAYAEDGDVVGPVSSGIQDYKNFNLDIPSGATILGIEVTSYGVSTVSTPSSFSIELSWNGGTTLTGTSNTYTHNHHGASMDYSYGTPFSNTGTYLWGRTWSSTELNNTNFLVRCTATVGTFDIDSIKVKVIYSVVNNDGIIYVLGGNSWVKHSEITFTNTKDVCLTQSSDKVIIWNDNDAFSFYDITTDKVTRFATVDNPVTALTLAKTGLAGTNFTIYYGFTYTGNGGETALSPIVHADITGFQDSWTAGDYFTITRPAVVDSDAVKWNLYSICVPNGTGTPVSDDYDLIQENIPLATNIIIDRGDLNATSNRNAPVTNTTVGIVAGYGVNINGRIWAIHDHTVYWGGNTGHELTFSGAGSTQGADGSGNHLIDQYGMERPMAIALGRDNSGASCINLITAGVAGMGSIYDVYDTTVTVDSRSVQLWQFKQREGNDGTNAPFSVIHANNNLYYLSLQGFKSTGVKPNIVGIQSTDIVSNAIRDKVELITKNDLKTCYATYFDEKILWTVAYGSDTNNQIWVYDILHGGIWSRWNIAADAIFNWVKSGSDSSKLYVVKDQNILYYQPHSIVHQDDDDTFTTVLQSGIVGFSPDRREWVYLLQVIFVLLRPLGKVHFSITAHTKRGDITKEDVVDFGGVSNSIGWNALTLDSVLNGSHNQKVHNNVYGVSSIVPQKEWVEVSLKFKKMVQYLTWKTWVEDKNSVHMISQVIPEFTIIGMDPDMLTRSDTYKI